MPLYEYECQSCRRQFELLVRESTALECPSCGGRDLAKQLSVFATATPRAGAMAPPVGPCGSCGHPDGPGSCRVS